MGKTSKKIATATKEVDKLFTFRITENKLANVQAVAYWERLTIKDLMNNALDDYITKYTKANGKIKPIPSKQ